MVSVPDYRGSEEVSEGVRRHSSKIQRIFNGFRRRGFMRIGGALQRDPGAFRKFLEAFQKETKDFHLISEALQRSFQRFQRRGSGA